MVVAQRTDRTPRTAPQMCRYWLLNELRRVRATVNVGSQSIPNARKERKTLQRDLANLRATRK
jgi:hypothetical protein